jgi:hypothetical protein
MTEPAKVIATEELRIVDAAGHTRMTLSAPDGTARVAVLGLEGPAAMELTVDATGHPSVILSNPLAQGATARLEIDTKGAHVRFDRPGGATAYLFVSNAGAEGVVLHDGAGIRRFSVVVDPAGEITMQP